MGINVCTFSGNVGRDPEIKYLESGTVLAQFSLAVAGWDSRAKEKKTIWLHCTAFNKTAELVGEYVQKGHSITVSGKLDIEEWEQEGIKRNKPVLIVQDVQLAARKSEQLSPSDH